MRYALICFILFCAFNGVAEASSPKAKASSPNIVFIIVDDLGWADVAFHGGNAPTPHLDQLAKESLELSQHYVAPVCSPTRAGFLTGRCWSRFGITTPTNELALPWDTITLPRALKTRGYTTFLAGKWHLGSLPKWGPNHFGFDHSYGSLAGGISPWNHRYKKGPYSLTWHRNHELLEERGHVTDLLTNETVRWIQNRSSHPFFLYIPFTAVHLPIKEPEPWLARVPKTIVGDVPRHYAACIMHLDHAIGRIIQTLKNSGIRENTLLVFTSDNGASTVENNDLKYPDDDCPKGLLPGNNHPLRGRKGDVYEGGTRVPTLVSWPNHIRPGRILDPVQITDWMPTFCSMAGYEAENDLQWDGADISKLLIDQTPMPDRSIYTAGPRWRAKSLRHGDWKLITHGSDESTKFELFNITKDPTESRDLANAYPKQVERMRLHLEKMSIMDRTSVAPD